jgi:hypothetical protein
MKGELEAASITTARVRRKKGIVERASLSLSVRGRQALGFLVNGKFGCGAQSYKKLSICGAIPPWRQKQRHPESGAPGNMSNPL